MSNYINKTKLLLIAGLLFLPASAFASVNFEQTPLFGEANFAPGNSVTRYVELKNEGGEKTDVMVRAFDYTDKDGLGDVIDLRIEENGDILLEKTFAEFFANGETILKEVEIDEELTLDFIATFKPDSGNDYQDKEFGFSLEVGFKGGEVENDTVAVGGSFGGGSVSPGAVSGSKNLIITNESADESNLGTLNSVLITWDTNIPATSQVVYGLVDNGPYTLDMNDVMFGYPFATPEIDISKVENHSVQLEGLDPGVYVYRVISRASPATVGFEKYFEVKSESFDGLGGNNELAILPNGNQVSAVDGTEQSGSDEGDTEVVVGGNSASTDQNTSVSLDDTDSNTNDNETIEDRDGNGNLASIFSALTDFSAPNVITWIIIILLILIIIYLIYFRNRSKE